MNVESRKQLWTTNAFWVEVIAARHAQGWGVDEIAYSLGADPKWVQKRVDRIKEREAGDAPLA